MKEGEGCGKLGAVRRSPITLAINVGDERVGNDAQIGDESGAVGRGDLDAVLAREGGESDASVGGTAGIEGIIAPATLEGEHHGEGRSEAVLVVDCGTGGRGWNFGGRGQAPSQHTTASERFDGDGVRLIAAQQNDVAVRQTHEEADVTERGVGAARDDDDGAVGGGDGVDAPDEIRAGGE